MKKRRKLKVYCDADIESALEEFLHQHRWIKCLSSRRLGFRTRGDDHHYREAFKRGAALITHDEDFLNNGKYPIDSTRGVIVLKRNQGVDAQFAAINRFLDWMWQPHLQEFWMTSALGSMKVRLSTEGLKYWLGTPTGIKAYEDAYSRRIKGRPLKIKREKPSMISVFSQRIIKG